MHQFSSSSGLRHRARSRSTKWVIGAALPLLLAAGQAAAQTRTWRNAVNGTFSTGSNWVGGVAPGAANPAAFGFTASTTPYTVTFSGNATTAGLTVSNQRPTFNLGGLTYTVNGEISVSGTNGPSLTLSDGVLNTSLAGFMSYIGKNVGQTGSVTVGTGATWIGANYVGYSGTGTLNVIGGGTVNNAPGGYWIAVGEPAASSGLVVVDGAGSAIVVTDGNLEVGGAGTGELRVTGGAHATASAVIAAVNGGRGTILVRGAGSRIDSTGSDASIGFAGPVGAVGSVTIEQGGVYTHGVFLHGGRGAGATGDFIVRDPGSQLITPVLNLADGGTSSLTVENGATATMESELNVSRVGSNSVGSVTVRGTGSVVNAGSISTGGGGFATIRIEDGGQLNAMYDVASWDAGTSRSIVITGTGSQLNFGTAGGHGLYCSGGTSSVRVESGGQLTGPWLYMSEFVPASMSLTVDGVGSSVSINDFTAARGSSDLQILNGAQMTVLNQFQTGCCDTPTTKSMLVRGPGSQLTVGDYPNTGGRFYFGYESTGTTGIVDQGGKLLVRNDAYIGHRGTGSLTVDGVGSSFESPYQLDVGFIDDWATSDGTLIVNNGATASVRTLWMRGGGDGGSAVVTVDNASLMTAPDSCQVGQAATLNIRNGSGVETGWTPIWGSPGHEATVKVESGGYLYSSTNIPIGGGNQTNALLGVLALDGGTVYALDYVSTNAGGVVRGSGRLEARVFNSGRMEPGNPLGVLSMTRLTLTESGVLAVQIGGTAPGSQHDQVSVDEAATIHGTLQISFANGFVPDVGQVFDILLHGPGSTGHFDSVVGTDLGNHKALVVQYLVDRVRLLTDSVTGVDITQPTLSVADGFTESLSATATYSASPVQNVTSGVVWSSDDPSIASVTADGKVTGHAAGDTTIRASYAGFSDSVPVTVNPLPVPAGLSPGLDAYYYELDFQDMDLLTPYASDTRSTLDITDAGPAGYANSGRTGEVGAIHTGQIIIPVEGDYTFYLFSDWVVSRLLLNNVPVTGTPRWPEYATAIIHLPAGAVDVRVDFENACHPNQCSNFTKLEWSGPGITRQIVPAEAWAAPIQTNYYVIAPYAVATEPTNFDALVPSKLTTRPNINFDLDSLPGPFGDRRSYESAASFRGWIAIPTDGTYTFSDLVDDGASIYIDGQRVIYSNRGFTWGTIHEGTVNLAAGIHEFRADAWQLGYYTGFILSMEGPGISRQVIPPSAFWRGTPAARCIADYNQDGGIDGGDVESFFADWEAGTPSADVNEDGGVDGADVQVFYAAWEVGSC